jgi:serine O-acetyltransferase
MTKNDLVNYVNSQLNYFFPDGYPVGPVIRKNIDESYDRINFSLRHVKLQGYTNFNHLHSDLYAQFLYFLSNSVWKNDGDKIVASKLFYLNKSLHGINCMYDTRLPDIFLLIHCVGTVLGKATYSNYFVACQKVTIGSDKGFSPILHEGVYMGPGSSVIGKCLIGKFTHLAINSLVFEQDTPEKSVVIGTSPNIVIKNFKRNRLIEHYFNIESRR